jgi:hypothetical protein
VLKLKKFFTVTLIVALSMMLATAAFAAHPPYPDPVADTNASDIYFYYYDEDDEEIEESPHGQDVINSYSYVDEGNGVYTLTLYFQTGYVAPIPNNPNIEFPVNVIAIAAPGVSYVNATPVEQALDANEDPIVGVGVATITLTVENIVIGEDTVPAFYIQLFFDNTVEHDPGQTLYLVLDGVVVDDLA